jgi:hypothetical protein
MVGLTCSHLYNNGSASVRVTRSQWEVSGLTSPVLARAEKPCREISGRKSRKRRGCWNKKIGVYRIGMLLFVGQRL